MWAAAFFVGVFGGGVFCCCQEVKDKLYDNFVKRGYTIDDLDGNCGSAGTTLRQSLRSAIYSHRQNPATNKLGAKRYAEMRKEFPKNSAVVFPDVAEDLVVRAHLAKLVSQCGNVSMRRRPEIAQWLLSDFETPLNDKEQNAIADIFLRCNARNPDQLDDMLCFMKYFEKVDIRTICPALHELLRNQMDLVCDMVTQI